MSADPYLESLKEIQSAIIGFKQLFDNELFPMLALSSDELDKMLDEFEYVIKQLRKTHKGLFYTLLLSYFDSIFVMNAEAVRTIFAMLTIKFLELNSVFLEVRQCFEEIKINFNRIELECKKPKLQQDADLLLKLSNDIQNQYKRMMDLFCEIQNDIELFEFTLDKQIENIEKNTIQELRKKLRPIRKCLEVIADIITIIVMIIIIMVLIILSPLIIFGLIVKAIYDKLTGKKQDNSETEDSSKNNSKSNNDPDADAELNDSNISIFIEVGLSIFNRINEQIFAYLSKPLVAIENKIMTSTNRQLDKVKAHKESLVAANSLVENSIFAVNTKVEKMNEQKYTENRAELLAKTSLA